MPCKYENLTLLFFFYSTSRSLMKDSCIEIEIPLPFELFLASVHNCFFVAIVRDIITSHSFYRIITGMAHIMLTFDRGKRPRGWKAAVWGVGAGEWQITPEKNGNEVGTKQKEKSMWKRRKDVAKEGRNIWNANKRVLFDLNDKAYLFHVLTILFGEAIKKARPYK